MHNTHAEGADSLGTLFCQGKISLLLSLPCKYIVTRPRCCLPQRPHHFSVASFWSCTAGTTSAWVFTLASLMHQRMKSRTVITCVWLKAEIDSYHWLIIMLLDPIYFLTEKKKSAVYATSVIQSMSLKVCH